MPAFVAAMGSAVGLTSLPFFRQNVFQRHDYAHAHQVPGAAAQGGSTVQRGAAVAPVPLNMKGLNPALVIKELMRHGTGFRGGATPVLQVMSWPVYGKMVDRDFEAVYECLKAIPSIQPRPDSCNQAAPPA